MAHTDHVVGNWIVRQHHSPDGAKRYGVSIIPADYDGTDVSRIAQCPSLAIAAILCGSSFFRFVKVDADIYKVFGRLDGVGEYPAGYVARAGAEPNPPRDMYRRTLAEARAAIGRVLA